MPWLLVIWYDDHIDHMAGNGCLDDMEEVIEELMRDEYLGLEWFCGWLDDRGLNFFVMVATKTQYRSILAALMSLEGRVDARF